MIQDIISSYNNYNSLYGNKLTNHLNMGLFALNRMGATEEMLHVFAKAYIKYNELPPLPKAKVVITEANFDTYLGDAGYYSSYIPYFKQALEKQDADSIIKLYLAKLIDGTPGGAFHGLIRLAYAYELKNHAEIAKALAYFAECYHPFHISKNMSKHMKKMDPIAAILKLSDNRHFKTKLFTRSLIIGRMEDIYEDELFYDVISDIDESYCTSQKFSELLVKIYAMTENFTILHGFTSTHALGVLSHLIPDYTHVLKHHWYLIQLAYLSTNCTQLQDIPDIDEPMQWEVLFKSVVQLKDVHTIKLVYSLFEQSKLAENDRLYRVMAQLKIAKSY